MSKSTEEFINEILEAELGNHSMLVDIREKIRLGKHLSSYEERYLNVLKRQTKNDHVLELPKKTKPKITYEKIKQKEQPKQPQEEITSAINEQEKLVAKKQKEFESYQTQISSQQDLHQSKQKELVKIADRVAEKQKEFESYQTQIASQQDLYQSKQKELVKIAKLVAEKQKEFESYQTQISSQQDLHQSKQKELVKMRTELLNIQTQHKVLHMQTDSQRKLLDEIKQSHSTHKLEEEYHELESELESKREEIVELKKQKQSVVQQTEQITQKIAEQEKQMTGNTNLLLSGLGMLEEQKAGILEEITQEQAKKQSQKDELQALIKERLDLEYKIQDRQGIYERIKKHRDNLHTVQNECSMLELEIKSQMNLLDEERQKEKEIIMRITQKYN